MVRKIIYDWTSKITEEREMRICLSNYSNDAVLSYCQEKNGKIYRYVYELRMNEEKTKVYPKEVI